MTENQQIQNYCNDCKKETKHLVKKEHRVSLQSSNFFEVIYQIIECCGCLDVSFLKIHIDYENHEFDCERNKPIPYIKKQQYPLNLQGHNKIDYPKLFDLPSDVRSIYEDVVKSYASGAKILTAVGMRSCIESVCNSEQIKGKDLANKIDRLCKDGHISKENAKLLHGILFLGNSYIHDIIEPKSNELDLALRIVESLLENVYILPKIAKGSLRLPIDDCDKIVKVLSKKLESFNDKDEFAVFKLLGNDYKYCKVNIKNFEQRLIQDINSNNFLKLKIGSQDTRNGNQVQKFIVQATN